MRATYEAIDLSAALNSFLNENGFEEREGVTVLFHAAAVRLIAESRLKGLDPAHAKAWAVAQLQQTLQELQELQGSYSSAP